jgi:hypothetical protein
MFARVLWEAWVILLEWPSFDAPASLARRDTIHPGRDGLSAVVGFEYPIPTHAVITSIKHRGVDWIERRLAPVPILRSVRKKGSKLGMPLLVGFPGSRIHCEGLAHNST